MKREDFLIETSAGDVFIWIKKYNDLLEKYNDLHLQRHLQQQSIKAYLQFLNPDEDLQNNDSIL